MDFERNHTQGGFYINNKLVFHKLIEKILKFIVYIALFIQ